VITNYHARTSKYRADNRERESYPRAAGSERRGYSIAGDFLWMAEQAGYTITPPAGEKDNGPDSDTNS
jgi:hypothetical protein